MATDIVTVADIYQDVSLREGLWGPLKTRSIREQVEHRSIPDSGLPAEHAFIIWDLGSIREML